MKQALPKVICLMGPTGSGKTQLAVELTKLFPCDIISVDSAMVYKGMDIGTAKPDKKTLQIAPHRLIDIHDPKEPYSAAQFKIDAENEIKKILSAGRIPLLVGGTMLYFRALQQGLAAMPSANKELRDRLQQEGNEKGWDVMHAKLAEVDQEAAARIHPNDPQRIQRALEVYLATGKNITAWQTDSLQENQAWDYVNIAIVPQDRNILHERIAGRFKQMLDDGLVEEVKALYSRGDLTIDLPAIRSVGYRQVWEYLLGNLTYNEMCDKAIIATRQLAKRQLTWLRSWPDVHWFDSEDARLLSLASAMLQKA